MESKNIHPWKRRWLSFRGFSIQQRLPLLICLLLIGVTVTFGLISYLSVRENAFKFGAVRLHSQSEQLASLFGQSAQGAVTTTRTTAQHNSIREFLRGQGSADSALHTIHTGDTVSILTELLDATGKSVLRTGKKGAETKLDVSKVLHVQPSDTGKLGKIYLIDDSMYFPVVAAVIENGKINGYLARWRVVIPNQRSMDLILRLMGTPKPNFYVGNSDHSLWTDMTKPITFTLPHKDAEDSSYKYTTDNGKMIAVSKPIKNTRWLLLYENRQQDVLGPAQAFLRKVILIGGVLIAIGIFVAWLMSRNITRPLKKLTAAASAIASGDYTSSVEVNRRDEVGKLGRAFNAMTVQVSKAKEELEMKIIETEYMNEQLRNLSAHLQNIREEERIHIAREMHDELGQFLTGLKMDIAWLNKKIGNTEENGAKHEKLLEMTKLVDDAVVFVRKLAAELRPSILDDLGLIAALEWHSREFNRRFNIEVKFDSKAPEFKTSELIATGLFRMYQESLTNVARHAEAKNITAILDVIDDQVHLSITDDGKGFDINNSGKRKTLGLLGMKERALMIGGTLEITSKPGTGTTIFITVPLKMESAPKAVLS